MFTEPEAKIDLSKITTIDTLLNSERNFEEMRSHISIQTAQHVFKQIKAPIHLLAATYIVPISMLPKDFFEIMMTCFQKKLDDVFNWPEHVQTGFAMRTVEAAFYSKAIADLVQTNLIQHLYETNPYAYSPAFFMQAIYSNNPIDADPQLGLNLRTSCLSLFYCGINLLMLHKYQDADEKFIHALAISKACKEIRSPLISKMSISAFLTHVERKVFFARIKPIYIENSKELSYWDYDGHFTQDSLNQFAQTFTDEIRKERARRVIIDTAKTTIKIPLKQLSSLTGIDDIEPIIAQLNSEGKLKVNISDSIVNFQEPSITAELESEIAAIATLTKDI